MKKRYLYGIGFLLILALAILIYLLLTSGRALDGPESIVWDATGKRFLVSNTMGRSIVSMSPEGRYSAFIKKGLNAPRGMAIWKQKLYVADETTLKVFDPQTAKLLNNIPVPQAKMLNDIALDKTGLIYITDTSADCVFLINPENGQTEAIRNRLLKAPNGIVYDMPRDQMFIVGFSKRSPILSLSTKDRSVGVFMDSIYSDLDGIAIDDLGRIYITTWSEDMIFMIPQEQNRFIAQFKEIRDAADIFYYLPDNSLIVPLFNQDKVIRIPLE